MRVRFSGFDGRHRWKLRTALERLEATTVKTLNTSKIRTETLRWALSMTLHIFAWLTVLYLAVPSLISAAQPNIIVILAESTATLLI
jgi:hypothetical protein